jgi:primosomal protein N' (replication factor Y)
MPELFAQVILPLSLHDSYTYKVPEILHPAIKPGQRVIVQFGQKKYYAALVFSLSSSKPENIEIKEIQQILDDEPVVLDKNFELWEWIAKYYCCTLGDVFRAGLPTGLKLESKSKVFSTGIDIDCELSEKEAVIVSQVEQDVVLLDDLQKRLGTKFSYAALKSLLAKNLIFIEEQVEEKYKPKTETLVRFHPSIKTETVLEVKISELQKAKKQVALLFHFCHKTNAFDNNLSSSVSKKELFEGTIFSAALLNELCKKEILVQFEKQVSRIENEATTQVDINLLNKHQEEALRQIESAFETKQVALIHGITASGKTEIYIHLIDEIIKSGRQALYLVPEIALTTQIIRRLKNVFGEKVGIYHSKLNSQERVEIWEKVLQFKTEPAKGYQVVLGARSAVFLPFSNLGIVIVDEEHENSFKQFDPSPRYYARDMAVVLGHQHNAKVLLGSATPSFESYFNTIHGKYALVNLFNRHADVELPEIIVADLKRAYKRKQMHSVLTPELYNEMEIALGKGEQIILFQNRRGYSPFVECFSCGWIPKCQNCDVSLTYHKFNNRLTCHYCGFSQALHNSCDSCGSPEVKTRGFGTEKIEDELKSLFKNARIARMDLDTTQNKHAFEKIIHNLETKKTDILVGTQMVTKGLDFDHVSVVGILNADNLINFPDFRAHERAYQLISQVSGRAGRKHKRGKVILQTSQPEHLVIDLVKNQNFNEFLKVQLHERKLFNYPPFYRLIKVIVKHKSIETVARASEMLAAELRKNKALIVLGPEFPLISRIQLWYQKEIWLKIDRKHNSDLIKSFILKTVQETKQSPNNSSCLINIDVDPF